MTAPGTPDAQAWLKDYQQRIAALKEKAEKAKAEMADNRVDLTSDDGHVKLSVTGAGSLQSLEISDSATAKPSELGKMVMQTYRKAVSQAGARTMEIMSGLGGPNSPAMEVVKDAVPPEPEDDEEIRGSSAPEVDERDLGIAPADDDEDTPPPATPPRPATPPVPQAPQQPAPPRATPPAEVDFEDDDDGFDGIDWDTGR